MQSIRGLVLVLGSLFALQLPALAGGPVTMLYDDHARIVLCDPANASKEIREGKVCVRSVVIHDGSNKLAYDLIPTPEVEKHLEVIAENYLNQGKTRFVEPAQVVGFVIEGVNPYRGSDS